VLLRKPPAPPGRAGAHPAGALPALVADAPVYAVPLIDAARDREIGEIAAALAGAGTLERRQLARLVHADLWGPGRFSPALREAVVQGKVRRTGRGLYALMPGAPGPGDGSPPADHAQHGDGTGQRPWAGRDPHPPSRRAAPGPAGQPRRRGRQREAVTSTGAALAAQPPVERHPHEHAASRV
jgi:hypothetical protein